MPVPAPLWALPLAPQRVHNKPSTSLLLVPEAGPLVDARLVNSSAVPPFKPRKVSSLLVSLSLFYSCLGGEEFDDCSSQINQSPSTNRDYAVFRRRSLTFPRSASICVALFSTPLHLTPSYDEFWILRIDVMFLPMSLWLSISGPSF